MRTLTDALAGMAIAVLFMGCGSTPAQESAACDTGADCASGLCVAGVCSDDFTSVSERDAFVVEDAGLLQPEDARETDTSGDTATDVRDPEDVRPEDSGRDSTPTDTTPGDTSPGDAVDTDDTTPTDTTPDAPDVDAPDTEPDAVEPDAVEPDVVEDVVEPRNSCGGFAELSAEPGVSCGPCALDEWLCDGNEAVVCSGTTVANACGGCEAVLLEPGSSCGTCGGGILVCDSADSTDCVVLDEEVNACGGCEALAGMPGAACGTCGTGAWVCDDGGVRCEGDAGAGAQNACGGCDALMARPGAACGLCGGGQWACAGEEQVLCSEDVPPELNACGGCATLGAPVGERCGTCNSGVWSCDGAEAAFCEGDAGAAATNLCGGCGELDEIPGTACGACGEVWQCGMGGEVLCVPAPRNACGGCSELDDAPGDRCFRPGCGFVAAPVLVCEDEDSLECVCDAPPEGCGDGDWDFVEEECDDGNPRSGDGCSSTCETEALLDDDATCGDAPRLPNNGRVTFDICDGDNDEGNAQSDACTGSRTGDDVVGRLTLTERSRVFVDARDADDSVPVDVVAYLRTSCDRQGSQIACGDDAPCDVDPDIGACVGDLQPRVAQFEIALDPGTYFLVVDNYEYDAGSVEFECGDVQLSIFTTPL